MPRFYFHIRERSDCKDEEGVDLPDVTSAYREAIKGARSILMDELEKGRLPLNGSIEVENEHGQNVFSVPFRSAVDIINE